MTIDLALTDAFSAARDRLLVAQTKLDAGDRLGASKEVRAAAVALDEALSLVREELGRAREETRA